MRKIKGESGSIIKYYVANPISTFKKKKKLHQVGYCDPTIMPLRNEHGLSVGFPQ